MPGLLFSEVSDASHKQRALALPTRQASLGISEQEFSPWKAVLFVYVVGMGI